MVIEMTNKELFALIEEYGTAREEMGRLSGADRHDMLIKACKLIAKIEREILPRPKPAEHKVCVNCRCADHSVRYSDWWYCTNPDNFRDFTVIRNGVKAPEWCKNGV